MKFLAKALSVAALAVLVSTSASAQILLNEIRTDQTGSDTDEYVELAGPAGASLAGYSIVVIGDGTGGCGVVEAAISLAAFSIQADGYFALRYSAGVALLTGYDATLTGSFENSDNLTFLLVTGNTAAVANDLDTNNDGILDTTPWATIVDQVGLSEGTVVNCTTDEYLYTTTVVGPDGTFAPGHVYRCGATWLIGPFGGVLPTGGVDTVGAANTSCPVPVAPSTWSNIKARISN
ncbi:MAG: hypothetical protein SGI90_02510 [Candidatus Eisenbacteria bacterium]|nr:hypothetical protein [Candidatus Eisenbacteria bacterium]